MTGAPLLSVEDLSRHYGGGPFGRGPGERALDGVSFTMAEGEILGIVGESGCGKSTLARLVAVLDRPTAGRVSLAGDSLHDLAARALRRRRRDVQMVFQDPQGSLDPRRTVGSSIAEPLHCLDPRPRRAARAARVAAILEAVGLPAEAASLYPHQFSGGQRQRIAIARALVTAPRLVVADEPTSALDLSIQAQVLNLILDLNRDRGTAFLFISHNLGAVGAVADRVAVMFRGRIVETGPAAALLAAPLHPYAALLVAAEPRIDDVERPEVHRATGPTGETLGWSQGCAFRLRCPKAEDRCAVEEPVLRSVADGRTAACHFPLKNVGGVPSPVNGRRNRQLPRSTPVTDLIDLTAVDLLAAFAARTVSPLDYWDAVERRIAAWEPRVAALYAYDPDGARREAAASAERWARGTPVGPLDGVPVTVKELIATRGVPVPRGSAATDLVPAAEDAPLAARLREDGAIIFAKTTCPDFGMLTSGLSSFHPLTRNPWNLALNPGGSSSGAAAAAAAGYGPLHVGTDIGGSIRLPAALTGTVGFKPSHGRVPIDPYYLGRCAGPMTRTVADAALMMATLARPDPRDDTALPPAEIAWDAPAGSVAGLRIGLMLDAGCGLPVDRDIRDAVTRAAGLFAAAGARVEQVPPVLSRAMLDGLDAFWRARSWADIRDMDEGRRGKVLPYILAWAEGGARVSGVDAVRGYDQTNAMRRACGRLFERVDAVISPTIPVVSYPADWASPANDPGRPFEHIAFTVPWNMGEQPALSLPCGMSASGMPIGLQIVGPRFADGFVLRLGRFFETVRGAAPAWPLV